MDFTEPKDRVEALDELYQHCKDGRRIVPLIGSGVSVKSGIPLLRSTVPYFLFMRYLHTSWAKAREYVEDNGWPSYQNLYEQFTKQLSNTENASWTSKRPVLKQLEENIHQTDFKKYNLKWLDWATCLSEMTDQDPVGVDSFFATLLRGRVPSLGHQALASLAPLLGWDLILTTNFDNLIETALIKEGLLPQTYEVSLGTAPPKLNVIRGGVAVVKLHGGSFNLRIGESANHPLDANSRSHIASYFKDDDVLLVMGIGGEERRVNHVVEEFLAGNKNTSESENRRKVYWFRRTTPLRRENFRFTQKSLDDMCSSKRFIESVCLDPAKTLAEFHGRAAASYPAGSTPHSTASSEPIGLFTIKEDESQKNKDSKSIVQTTVGLPEITFDQSARNAVVHVLCPEKLQSRYLDYSPYASALASLYQDYRIIWVDCEVFHTIGGVVTHILSSCRQSDIGLPFGLYTSASASVLSDRHFGKKLPEVAVKKAVRSILTALSRDRYVLVFDNVGSFGRPFTLHHGLVGSSQATVEEMMGEIIRLLETLLDDLESEWPSGDSTVVISLTPPVFRYHSTGNKVEDRYRSTLSRIDDIRKRVESFLKIRGHVHKVPNPPDNSTPLPMLFQTAQVTGSDENVGIEQLMTPILSVFRRPRSVLSIHAIMDMFFSDEVGSRSDWNKKVGLDGSAMLEGGHLWMRNDLRDDLYERLSAGAPARPKDGQPESETNLSTLIFLVTVHDFAASHLYHEMYTPTHDPDLFFEHVYHRVSNIRQCTSLVEYIISRSNSETVEKLLRESFSKSDSIGMEPFYKYLANQLRLYGFTTSPQNNPLIDLLNKWRRSQIDLLRAALVRERDVLLSEASPDRVLYACYWMLSEDISRMARPVPSKDETEILECLCGLYRDLSELICRVFRIRGDVAGLLSIRMQNIVWELMGGQYEHFSDPLKAWSELKGEEGDAPNIPLRELLKKIDSEEVTDKVLTQLAEEMNFIATDKDREFSLFYTFNCLCDIALSFAVARLSGFKRIVKWLAEQKRSNNVLVKKMLKERKYVELQLRFEISEIVFNNADVNVWGLLNNDRLDLNQWNENSEQIKQALNLAEDSQFDTAYAFRQCYVRLLRERSMSILFANVNSCVVGEVNPKDSWRQLFEVLNVAEAVLKSHSPSDRTLLASIWVVRAECNLVRSALVAMEDPSYANVLRKRVSREVESAHQLLRDARPDSRWWREQLRVKAQWGFEELYAVYKQSEGASLTSDSQNQKRKTNEQIKIVALEMMRTIRQGVDCILVPNETEHSEYNFSTSVVQRFLEPFNLLWCKAFFLFNELGDNLWEESQRLANTPAAFPYSGKYKETTFSFDNVIDAYKSNKKSMDFNWWLE